MDIVIPPHFVNASFAKNPLLLSVYCWILLAPWSRLIFRWRTLRIPRPRHARKRLGKGSPTDNANYQRKRTSELWGNQCDHQPQTPRCSALRKTCSQCGILHHFGRVCMKRTSNLLKPTNVKLRPYGEDNPAPIPFAGSFFGMTLLRQGRWT